MQPCAHPFPNDVPAGLRVCLLSTKGLVTMSGVWSWTIVGYKFRLLWLPVVVALRL